MNSMLGALVGDAAGATLEFFNSEITEDIALYAMTMPGGGCMRVGPGQITDDGELTLTLWQSLNSFEKSDVMPILTLMKGYLNWYNSRPFDMGRTCSLAFEVYYDFFINNTFYTIKECKERITNLNYKSEANGALMRASAIATWIVANPEMDIAMGIECAKEDARLSHPNIICQETNAIYVLAIVHLLKGKTPIEVIKILDTYIENEITSNTVKQWYFIESIDISELNAKHHIGHVRWGFVLAMYFLRNPSITYEEAIKITLMKGGDTDTNAAIVGGLVGTYQTIPEYMLKPVLEFDCTIKSHMHRVRPKEYSVKRVVGHLI